MRSLHGHEAALEDAAITATVAVSSSPLPSTAHQRRRRSKGNKMPNIALRFSSSFRKIFHNSLRRNTNDGGLDDEESNNRHAFDTGVAAIAPRVEDFAGANTPWLTEYLHGVSMEIYSSSFSAAFDGMTFAEAATLCMQKLEIMLIAILAQSIEEERDGGPGHYPYLAINPPSTPHSVIHKGTIGFFICDSQVSIVNRLLIIKK